MMKNNNETGFKRVWTKIKQKKLFKNQNEASPKMKVVDQKSIFKAQSHW